MDRQAIFDRVVGHMLVQGEKSTATTQGAGSNACKYRGPRKLRCGIGAIIPDELYTSSMECKGITTLLLTRPLLRKYFEVKNDFDSLFLNSLQRIHDTIKVEAWMWTFREFAIQNGLRWTWDADAVIEERSRCHGSPSGV